MKQLQIYYTLSVAVPCSKLTKQLVEKGMLDKKLLTNLWLDVKPKLTALQHEVSPADMSSSRPFLSLSVAQDKALPVHTGDAMLAGRSTHHASF